MLHRLTKYTENTLTLLLLGQRARYWIRKRLRWSQYHLRECRHVVRPAKGKVSYKYTLFENRSCTGATANRESFKTLPDIRTVWWKWPLFAKRIIRRRWQRQLTTLIDFQHCSTENVPPSVHYVDVINRSTWMFECFNKLRANSIGIVFYGQTL